MFGATRGASDLALVPDGTLALAAAKDIWTVRSHGADPKGLVRDVRSFAGLAWRSSS